MSVPYILAVDDDADVLRAITGDLRRHYGKQFRLLYSSSGQEALEATKEAKLRNEPIALFLADQRMPGMTGVEFLTQARDYFPESKRALLTAYADTDAAVRAINDAKLDYYLMKPWDPPEERLYPVLDDMLDEWQASFRPPFHGVRIVGHRWSPESHEMRDFLARNQVPFAWHETGADEQADALLQAAGLGTDVLPVVILDNGVVMTRPSIQDVADQLQLRHKAESPLYDLVIVGGGPAGLAGAVYGASEGLRTCIVERHADGGQAGMSSRIENYLGFPQGVSGQELARRARDQVVKFGAERLLAHEACKLCPELGSVGIEMNDGSRILGLAAIIATGVSYRRLETPGADRLAGRGVYYGAARVEAESYRDQQIYVVGGANSAGQAAVFFADRCQKVTMLVRGDSLSSSMSHYLIAQIEAIPNIDVRTNVSVEECLGDEHLEAIRIRDSATGDIEEAETPGLFVFIGAKPSTEWLKDSLLLDDRGFIVTGADIPLVDKKRWNLERPPFLLETSAPGVFAAGDVRHGSGKRVATAVGEGATAVMSVWQYRSHYNI
ncbi:MAG: FAD-dependent oxidoreductase [Thermomicrobiales bacterium]|nr:FAD-dependent oxidoreductase [Thermomicrobiales bacterium]